MRPCPHTRSYSKESVSEVRGLTVMGRFSPTCAMLLTISPKFRWFLARGFRIRIFSIRIAFSFLCSRSVWFNIFMPLLRRSIAALVNRENLKTQIDTRPSRYGCSLIALGVAGSCPGSEKCNSRADPSLPRLTAQLRACLAADQYPAESANAESRSLSQKRGQL